PGFNSFICKVTLTLTAIKGPEVEAWARNMGNWLNELQQLAEDIPFVWDHFEAEFLRNFSNSSRPQCTRQALDNHCMRFPKIDQYISKFEDLIRLSGYQLGTEESNQMFLKGLTQSVMEETVKPPLPQTYNAYKQRAIEVTAGKQIADANHQRRPQLFSQYQVYG